MGGIKNIDNIDILNTIRALFQIYKKIFDKIKSYI